MCVTHPTPPPTYPLHLSPVSGLPHVFELHHHPASTDYSSIMHHPLTANLLLCSPLPCPALPCSDCAPGYGGLDGFCVDCKQFTNTTSPGGPIEWAQCWPCPTGTFPNADASVCGEWQQQPSGLGEEEGRRGGGQWNGGASPCTVCHHDQQQQLQLWVAGV
jgi:hypothetical protein